MPTTLNIGPSSIAEAGTPSGPAFTMSRSDWITIQTYCTDAKALPTTDTSFRNSLGPGAPSDLSDFEALITAYVAINTHVDFWTKTAYPESVALASAIYEYGKDKAPVFYPPILKEAKILEDNPNDEKAKAALKAILDNLQKDARDKEAKAKAVADQITKFADDTQSDLSTLVGPDGKAGLVKYYNDKYGKASADVVELGQEIDAQRLLLKAANDEYNHDVVVAATTPSYAWVWPAGTIAAAVVAGIYGHRAVEALDRARAAQDKINKLTADLAADANLMVAINSAEHGMTTIIQAISAALPVIQKIQASGAASPPTSTTLST